MTLLPTLLLLLDVLTSSSGRAAPPDDPAASAPRLRRGSPEEAAEFEKHLLPFEKKPKPAPAPKAAAAPQKPAGGFGVAALQAAPKAVQAPAPAPEAEPEPESDETVLEYELEDDAEVAVQVMATDGSLVREIVLAPGLPGARKGANKVVLWDGRDAEGKPAAPGQYMAVQSIDYRRPDPVQPDPVRRMIPLTRKSK